MGSITIFNTGSRISWEGSVFKTKKPNFCSINNQMAVVITSAVFYTTHVKSNSSLLTTCIAISWSRNDCHFLTLTHNEVKIKTHIPTQSTHKILVLKLMVHVVYRFTFNNPDHIYTKEEWTLRLISI